MKRLLVILLVVMLSMCACSSDAEAEAEAEAEIPWQDSVSVRFVQYTEISDSIYDYVYEITNESGRTLRGVEARVAVFLISGDIEFEEYIGTLHIGETKRFEISDYEVEFAFKEAEREIPKYTIDLDVVEITWNKYL